MNVSLALQCGNKLGRGDRAEFDEAVQTGAVPPAPNADATPPSAVASAVVDGIMEAFTQLSKFRRARIRADDPRRMEASRFAGEDTARYG